MEYSPENRREQRGKDPAHRGWQGIVEQRIRYHCNKQKPSSVIGIAIGMQEHQEIRKKREVRQIPRIKGETRDVESEGRSGPSGGRSIGACGP